MPKIQSDVGAIAAAIGKIADWLKLRIQTAEVRTLKKKVRDLIEWKRFAKKLSAKVRNDTKLKRIEQRINRRV